MLCNIMRHFPSHINKLTCLDTFMSFELSTHLAQLQRQLQIRQSDKGCSMASRNTSPGGKSMAKFWVKSVDNHG